MLFDLATPAEIAQEFGELTDLFAFKPGSIRGMEKAS